MSLFLMARTSFRVLPFTHSVANDEDAIALPQPNVLNLDEVITPLSSTWRSKIKTQSAVVRELQDFRTEANQPEGLQG